MSGIDWTDHERMAALNEWLAGTGLACTDCDTFGRVELARGDDKRTMVLKPTAWGGEPDLMIEIGGRVL